MRSKLLRAGFVSADGRRNSGGVGGTAGFNSDNRCRDCQRGGEEPGASRTEVRGVERAEDVVEDGGEGDPKMGPVSRDGTRDWLLLWEGREFGRAGATTDVGRVWQFE